MSPKERRCGLFLPVTSLPGPYGVGGFGDESRRFIDLVAGSGAKAWQILPLAYAEYHFCPYSTASLFAKHHAFIDPADLITEGLLAPKDAAIPHLPRHNRLTVTTLRWKDHLLTLAYERFERGAAPHLKEPFREYLAANSDWLPDFALFAAISAYYPDRSWRRWPHAIRTRRPEALLEWEFRVRRTIHKELFTQFLLDKQWQAVRTYAAGKGVSIIGDLPMYPALDSADVWQHPQYFAITRLGRILQETGAPGDGFNSRGQRWGSVPYRWRAIANDGFKWPLRRIAVQLHDVDILRIDHFFGYVRYWSIPEKKGAMHGRWVRGLGGRLFSLLRARYGPERFILETLGHGSPAADRLASRFGAPFMRVMCLELDWVDNSNAAITFRKPTVAYTTTHDTNTLAGWYGHQPGPVKRRLQRWWKEHGVSELPLQFRFISPLLHSKAEWVIIPLQDVLGLGAEARINRPGTTSARNWTWRTTWEDFSGEAFTLLRRLCKESGRA